MYELHLGVYKMHSRRCDIFNQCRKIYTINFGVNCFDTMNLEKLMAYTF